MRRLRSIKAKLSAQIPLQQQQASYVFTVMTLPQCGSGSRLECARHEWITACQEAAARTMAARQGR